MMGKSYNATLNDLQVELCKLQQWVKQNGERIIVIFEGRDSAGKGGMIRTFQHRVSQRVFRSVALPAPSDAEKTQWYPQRYVHHFPSAGQVILFDRSWYNRAGVEPVMGFCSDEQHQRFLRDTPKFEEALVESGIRIIKYWLEIDRDVQRERLLERANDPRKYWKLSPMDLKAQSLWYEYSRARDQMLAHTDTAHAPWYIVPSNDQKAARLNCIAHFLSLFPYESVDYPKPSVSSIEEPDASGAYDDTGALDGRNIVPARFDES